MISSFSDFNYMRPPTEKERRQKLIDMRPLFIEEVSKGKKTQWDELTFWEKRKVKDKCEIRYNMMEF